MKKRPEEGRDNNWHFIYFGHNCRRFQGGCEKLSNLHPLSSWCLVGLRIAQLPGSFSTAAAAAVDKERGVLLSAEEWRARTSGKEEC